MEDFKTLCYVIGVDFDNLPGEKKDTKIMELLQYLIMIHHRIEQV